MKLPDGTIAARPSTALQLVGIYVPDEDTRSVGISVGRSLSTLYITGMETNLLETTEMYPRFSPDS